MYVIYLYFVSVIILLLHQEFEAYEMSVENRTDVNGIIIIREGGVIIGNITCLFDEFVTSK